MKKYLFVFFSVVIIIFGIVYIWNYYYEINEDKKLSLSRDSLIDQKRDFLVTNDWLLLFQQSLNNGGEWLLDNQREDGSFYYERDIKTGELTDSENNIVRQSGTLYGLAKLYRYTKDTRYKEALLKGFKYFDQFAETKEIDGTQVRFFKYHGSVQANTVALHILAYLELAEADEGLTMEMGNKLQEMTDFIRLSQQSSGAFQNYFLNNVEIQCWESDYNNAESFLALVRMYRYTDDSKYLPILEKSANYLMEKYKDFNLQFYSWGTMAFSELYELTSKNEYKDFAYDISDQLLINSSTEYITIEHFLDNKSDALPGYSQVVQTEGLLLAYKLALRDNPDLEKKYREAIINSLAFHAVFQSPWEETLPERIYQKVKGGFCNRSDCVTQRIDMVHHAISAYVDALQIIDKDKLHSTLPDS